MKPDMRRFIARRADLLTFLFLTDCPDVRVDRLSSRQPGSDFRVTLAEGGVATEKAFRVVFAGVPGRVENPAELASLLPREEVRTDGRAGARLPLCLFVFTMADDQGYYGWLNEPVSSAPRGLRQRSLAEVCLRKLDENAMAEIISAVNAWYDAQRQAQAA